MVLLGITKVKGVDCFIERRLASSHLTWYLRLETVRMNWYGRNVEEEVLFILRTIGNSLCYAGMILKKHIIQIVTAVAESNEVTPTPIEAYEALMVIDRNANASGEVDRSAWYPKHPGEETYL